MVLNGAAVLEAIFLPASKAEQYPRIASCGEVTLEWGQPAVPRMTAVLPPLQEVDLRPHSFVIAVLPLLGVTLTVGMLPALVGPHICLLLGPLLLPEVPWGDGVAFAALQSITPLQAD